MQIDPVLASAAQSGAAIIVLLDALAKWRRPAAFRNALAAWQIVPEALVRPGAIAIAAAETLGALALLCRQARLEGATLLIVLFALFAAGLVVNILRGHTDIDCGCSGLASVAPGGLDTIPRGIGWWHVARLGFLAALTATAYLERTARPAVSFDYLTLLFAVLSIVCALLTLDALIANGPKLEHLRNS
ncbi:MauE/DoxX family redox-associated membrane protein [Paraburkholderia sp. J11-2]|uniref:MauE/DoxX family redox-associated membrane protein n=1 Tax=Paraburkholderia sp. J11-2 TaxID=2805431 RepID=UPI002AB6F17F|nr:MauE/DoxX family redox-associated membrane protein [Paraburkholderia sp. J11-2]